MEAPTSSKCPDQDLKDMDDLWSSKTNLNIQCLYEGYIKPQELCPNNDQDAKFLPGFSRVLYTPKSGLTECDFSFHPENQVKSQNL